MKKSSFPLQASLLSLFVFFSPLSDGKGPGDGLFSQTAVLYNSTASFYVDAGAAVFVDGDIVNAALGHFSNNGDIYLTRDWENHEGAGALNPNSGTVYLAGNAQVIKGTQITTFNNLICQNTATKRLDIDAIVGGNTGALALNDAPFDLNSNTLIITNPAPAAITRNNGYIISETDPVAGYGNIQWRIGNSSAGNNYVYPFGTFSGNYIPFLYNITAAGNQTTFGSIEAATYPTGVTASPNNRPLPLTVTNLDDPATNAEAAPYCADRFWHITAYNYNAEPSADIVFSYLESEWDNTGGSTNNIVEDSLKAWRWSAIQWQNPAIGTVNISANTVSVTGLSSAAGPWTLKGAEPLPPPPCGDFWLPNAFSPNGDGKNDFFRPRNNCMKDLELRIFNRWGNIVFETTDINTKGWDGSTPEEKAVNSEVFVYTVKCTLTDGTFYDLKGNVSVVK